MVDLLVKPNDGVDRLYKAGIDLMSRKNTIVSGLKRSCMMGINYVAL
jgi:hypothetical protein